MDWIFVEEEELQTWKWRLTVRRDTYGWELHFLAQPSSLNWSNASLTALLSFYILEKRIVWVIKTAIEIKLERRKLNLFDCGLKSGEIDGGRSRGSSNPPLMGDGRRLWMAKLKGYSGGIRGGDVQHSSIFGFLSLVSTAEDKVFLPP